MTSGASFASSAVTWFTRPRAGTWGGVDTALGGGEGLAGAGGGVGVGPVYTRGIPRAFAKH